MSRRLLSVALLIANFAGASYAVPMQANTKDPKGVVEKAWHSYYSLKAQGMLEFRCNVQPDWNLTYKSVKADPSTMQDLMPLLQKTYFKVIVGPEGASTVSHESDVAPSNEKLAESMRKSIGGIEQILTGFFQTWSGFVVNPLLPATDSDYRVEELGDKYRLTYKEGATTDVVTTLDHNFAIEQFEVTEPNLTATLRPTWTRNEKGLLLLTGYNAT